MTSLTSSVSVVIATLGGELLSKTIAIINSGSLIPTEILICIPEQYSSRVSEIHDTNVRLIITSFMGQVAQRAEGFRQAKEALVMQLDDDIELKADALNLMVEALYHLGRKNVVGPIFINSRTGMSLSPFHVGFKGWINSAYYYLIGGMPFGKSRMGCLSSICVSSSVDPQFFAVDIVKTQWLAGGCVLSYRDDLILENFFPALGKAYAEDALHSYYRTKLGITHNVVLDARAAIELPTNALNWPNFLQEMRVRIKIVQIIQGSILRKIIYIFFETVRRMLWGLRL
jgi:hypothetical protein